MNANHAAPPVDDTGNYFFGVITCLIIAKSIKLFVASPRPYFLSVCRPNGSDCLSVTEDFCSNSNMTELDDAR